MILTLILLIVVVFMAFRPLRDAFFTILGAVILIGLSTCVLRAEEDYSEKHKTLRAVYEECLVASRSDAEERKCRDTYTTVRDRLLDAELKAFALYKAKRQQEGHHGDN